MKKFFLIFIITLLIFVGSSFMAAKEAEAQGFGSFGVGVMLNYGIFVDGSLSSLPICIDILFNPVEFAIGWDITNNSLYLHGGLLIGFFHTSDIIVYKSGVQLYFIFTDPDMIGGFRTAIEAEMFFFPIPLCIFVGANILIPVTPDVGLEVAISVGCRFYL